MALNPLPVRKAEQKGGLSRSKVQNLLLRLQKRKQEVLRFTRDYRSLIDNNQAERDLRKVKLKQKISGEFHSLLGARISCRIRGYLSYPKEAGS